MKAVENAGEADCFSPQRRRDGVDGTELRDQDLRGSEAKASRDTSHIHSQMCTHMHAYVHSATSALTRMCEYAHSLTQMNTEDPFPQCTKVNILNGIYSRIHQGSRQPHDTIISMDQV